MEAVKQHRVNYRVFPSCDIFTKTFQALIKIELDEQTKWQTPPSVSLSLHRGSYTIYLCSPFDPDLLLFVVFGHLLGDKGPFQRKRMAVHVNEDALFTVEVGQTCALRSLKRAHKHYICSGQIGRS